MDDTRRRFRLTYSFMNTLLYKLLILLATPVALAHILWKSVHHQEPRYLSQRTGFGYSAAARHFTGRRWFHCASVGEINTLLPLLKYCHAHDASFTCIVTTNTITGARVLSKAGCDFIQHAYLPFDWSFSIRRFLKAFRPSALYVMETEIWPRLYAACARNNINITLINARLSSKTLSANVWIKQLLRDSLNRATQIAARSEKDANAYRSLGVDPDKVSVAGNLKLTTAMQPDAQQDAEQAQNNFRLDTHDRRHHATRHYVVVASTHDDEEQQILDCWRSLNRDELLVIAPRHPERGPGIKSALAAKLDPGAIAMRSRNETITRTTKLYILDTIGELKNYFANARCVIMGGSFVPVGGHNILEPASFATPVITGPHMENFVDELALMQQHDAIIQVFSIKALADAITTVLDHEDTYRSLVYHAKELSHDVEQVLEAYAGIICK